MSTIKLLAVGDICLKTKGDKEPFDSVKESFGINNILFGNLETALSNKGKEVERAVPLHVSPDRVSLLKSAGFNVLNIANNHTMDMGPDGFRETIEILHQNNIHFIGGGSKKYNGSHAIIDKNGIRLGFLGYNSISYPAKSENDIYICNLDIDHIKKDIHELKSKSDVIIISLHWGLENVFYPSPDQIKMSRELIDEGVSLILGHHPSVLQGIEKYNDGLIVYSLGNFQFIDDAHQSIVEKTKETMILVVDISKSGIEKYNIIPVKINEDYVPVVANQGESDKILSFIDEISRPITTGAVSEKWWFEKIAKEHLVGNLDAWAFRIRKYGIKHFFLSLRWIISRFQIRCYLGLVRTTFKDIVKSRG